MVSGLSLVGLVGLVLVPLISETGSPVNGVGVVTLGPPKPPPPTIYILEDLMNLLATKVLVLMLILMLFKG